MRAARRAASSALTSGALVVGLPAGHPVAAGHLGQADDAVAEHAAVVGVDVGFDQVGDGVGHAVLDPADGVGELLVPPGAAAEEQAEGVALQRHEAEVGREPRLDLCPGAGGARPRPW